MKRKKVLNEMGLGTGAVAGGPMGEGEVDMGPPGDFGMEPPGADMGDMDELESEDEADEEGDHLECDKAKLRELLDAVETGEMSADEAFEELNASCMDDMDDMDDDMGGDMGGDMDDMPEGLDDDSFGECMESIKRIAKLITEDPDILN